MLNAIYQLPAAMRSRPDLRAMLAGAREAKPTAVNVPMALFLNVANGATPPSLFPPPVETRTTSGFGTPAHSL